MASSRARSEALAAWLAGQRWFASKTRRIERVDVEDQVRLGDDELVILAVALDDGSVDRYAAPLRPGEAPRDALDAPVFCLRLLELIRASGRAPGEMGELVGRATRAFPRDLPADVAVRRIGSEQSNTSIVFGDRLILKHFRRLREGINPEEEIGDFLTGRTSFRHVAQLAGHLEYRRRGGVDTTLAVLQELVPGAEDGWEWTLAELRRFLARARETGEAADRGRLGTLAGESLHALRVLGERTAELHLALASDPEDPAFAPEPIRASDVEAWSAAILAQLDAARAVVGDRLPTIPDVRTPLSRLLGRRKIRHHGDYHLGQTLRVEAHRDFVIIDFEGEPVRALEERRRKHAAVRDVAGMLRSIDYAAESARDGDERVEGWARAWEAEAAAAFGGGYLARAAGAPFLPDSVEGFSAAVAAFEVEKAAYEIVYEANNRPDWIRIPMAGLLRASARLRQRTGAGAA